MHEEDTEMGILGNEADGAEGEENAALYTQAHSFYQQPMALQRLQFAPSASPTSVSSMSSATTPPLPPPPQTAGASLQQQQQQKQQYPQPTAAQTSNSATAVRAHPQQQAKIRPEQMISAADVSVNVNASAAAAYKRQQQKLRRLRELHSLALEGGDTARGYCSCDEQWTSSSPPTSGSLTLSCNEGHEKTFDASESNEAREAAALPPPPPPSTATATATLAPSAETTVEMAGEWRMAGSAYKQINVTTGRGRLAVGANDSAHSRTRQQQRHDNPTNFDGVASIWTGTRANEVAKAAAAVVAAKAAGAALGRMEGRPVPAARLKQQHHVRFSDEKNFSD